MYSGQAMKLQKLALSLLVAASLVAGPVIGLVTADPPASPHPGTPRPGGGGGGSGSDGDQQPRRGSFGNGHFRGGPDPTPQELKETEEFVKTYSPHRYEAMQKSGVNWDDPNKWVVREIVRKYRELKSLEIEDKESYLMRLDQMRKEDEIFVMAAAVKQAVIAKAPDADEQKANLRSAVAELIHMRSEERKQRITTLEASLKVERDRLEAEQKNFDAIVDRRVDTELWGMTGRPGGFHRDGSGGPSGSGPGSRKPAPATTTSSAAE